MAVNKFEKNVQKMMDEFKLHPSEEVWQNVEKNIANRKRKRRIIFFMAFSFLGLMVAWYGINNFLTSSNITTQKNQKLSGKLQAKTNDGDGSGNNQKIKTKNIKPDKITARDEALNKRSVNDKHIADQNHRTNEIKKVWVQNKSIDQLKKRNATPFIGSIQNKKEQEKNSVTDAENKSTTQDISSEKNQVHLTDVNNQRMITAIAPKNITINKTGTVLKNSDQDKIDNALSGSKKISNHDKSSTGISWGFNFSTGSSKITQNSFFRKGGDQSKSYSSSNPGTVNGGSSGFMNPQSASNSSFAFQAGVTINKNISKRSKLSTGLQYTYLADRIKTGTKQTSNAQLSYLFNISAYYASTAQESFTDRFHFIELPVMYDWRITGNTNHFLSINAGASINYLISTNALVYDTTAGGIYYHHNSLFTRTSMNFISGLSYHFGGKNFKLAIGPRFSFNLNDIIKSDLDQRRYFLYSGLDASMIFEKNKKK